jgi:hypothetical protein
MLTLYANNLDFFFPISRPGDMLERYWSATVNILLEGSYETNLSNDFQG